MNIQLSDVSHIIQLSIAPVFLLSGIGPQLIVLTNRLARIIDRSRGLEELLHHADTADKTEYLAEIEILYRRAHQINYAITLSTACALLVSLIIVVLFLGDALGLALDRLIAVLFVVAMLALIGSYSFLLREIFIATRSLSLRHIFKYRQ
ncbi:MAG: DUF2721 domain-containing protein [Oxalobacteraceae bacterium]|nr:DUF2721 domain-containing protein [Oxalobacteraceae bacterium]